MTGVRGLFSMRCVVAALLAFGVAGCDGPPPPPERHSAPDLPPARTARFVKFEEVTELTADAWAAVAEFNLIDSTGADIDRAQWKATADSTAANAAPENAIDGDPKSLWHTRWEGPDRPPMPPHWLVISLGRRVKISGFRYLPRQDGTLNGPTIGRRRRRRWSSSAGRPKTTSRSSSRCLDRPLGWACRYRSRSRRPTSTTIC
jgi:hypothetical protein